jgi:hypothetical protein
MRRSYATHRRQLGIPAEDAQPLRRRAHDLFWAKSKKGARGHLGHSGLRREGPPALLEPRSVVHLPAWRNGGCVSSTRGAEAQPSLHARLGCATDEARIGERRPRRRRPAEAARVARLQGSGLATVSVSNRLKLWKGQRRRHGGAQIRTQRLFPDC